MLKQIITFCVLPSLLGACGGGNSSPTVAVKIPFRQLAPFYGPVSAQNLVIQSEAQWASVLKDTPKPTSISGANFKSETVLMVGLGIKPTRTWFVRFLSVEQFGEKLVANVEISTCGDGGLPHQVDYPANAVAIASTTKEVAFNITQSKEISYCAA